MYFIEFINFDNYTKYRYKIFYYNKQNRINYLYF